MLSLIIWVSFHSLSVMLQYIKNNTTMSKYNVYMNNSCVWEGDDYDVALQEYTDCINEDPYAVIDLYEIDRYGNMICLEGIN